MTNSKHLPSQQTDRLFLGLLSAQGLLLTLALTGCAEPAETYLDVLDMSGADAAMASGLPCEVSQVLAKNCTAGCHVTPPAGVPKLLSYADLTAASTADPNQKVVERALIRMQDPARPMPPSGIAAAADVAVLQAWVSAGLPMGTCDSNNPYNTKVVCTSGQSWTGGNQGSSSMNPGQACIACHAKSTEAPKFQIGGTVYPTAHEPDNCVGTSAAGTITVEITDSKGTVVNLTANSSGNFSYRSRTSPLQLPYTAKVKQGTKVRVMTASQMNGDCNSCHTQDGTSGAPGRIMAP